MATNGPSSGKGLDFATLDQFAETIKAPFRRAFDCSRVELFSLDDPLAADDELLERARRGNGALYDQDSGRLAVPLADQGRALAHLVLHGIRAEQVGQEVRPFLTALVEASLEMARLSRRAHIDQLTGLANEEALDLALTNALARLGPPAARRQPKLDPTGPQPGLCLLAARPRAMSALLERHGRRFANRLLGELAKALAESVPEALALARVSASFMILLSGDASTARRVGGRLTRALAGLKLKPQAGANWPARVALGAATAPAGASRGRLAAEAAAILKARAQRAVKRAETHAGSDFDGKVLMYGELVEQWGRVKEMMPLDKVLIDLGRAHGLGPGERFMVLAQGPAEGSTLAKAEILVVEVGEDQSVAEVVALNDPTSPIAAGDRLTRLPPDTASEADADQEGTVSISGSEVRVVLDEVTGLAGHRSLSALLGVLAESDQPFSAALIRADGLEGVRETLGRMAVEALMRNLAEILGARLPAGAVAGRHAPDTLALLLPGMDAEAAVELCKSITADFHAQSDRTASAGLAAHPQNGFKAAEALDNAAKALVHAGFFGPDTVTGFDAVSLNISGDALFAQGRIGEAVAEYQRALMINPAEPNVLNSMGVCLGHLGQMDKAAEHFQKAQEAAPQDFMAYYNLGYAWLAQGKPNRARQQLEKALELNPDHADTLFQLGRLSQSEGRAARAAELFARAAAQEDCRPAVHRALGEALAADGRAAQAEEAFKKAVKANPSEPAALAGLAGLYLDRGANLEIALDLARRAHRIMPDSVRYARVVARALIDLGRPEQAAELLAGVAAANPEDPFLLVQLAQAEKAMSQTDEARDHLLAALRLEPNLESARSALAELEQD